MYSQGATTRLVQPEGAMPEFVALTDQQLAEASLHPEVLAEQQARFDLETPDLLAPGWLDGVNTAEDLLDRSTAGDPEPTAMNRVSDVEFYDAARNARNRSSITAIADRMPTIRSLAIQNGRPSFAPEDSQDNYTTAA